MNDRRLTAVFIAVADVALLVAGLVVAVRRGGFGQDAVLVTPGVLAQTDSGHAPPPGPPLRAQTVSAAEVANRPRPRSVTAEGRWPATLVGAGDRLVLRAEVVAYRAVDDTTVELTSPDPRGAGQRGTALTLPDGSRWYPLTHFGLEGGGDVPLGNAIAKGDNVDGWLEPADFRRMLDQGGIIATGSFVQRGGAEVRSLALPAGTRLSIDCPNACADDSPTSTVSVTIRAQSGLRMDVIGSTELGAEVEVAGAAQASALGSTWEGLVGSLEAGELRATAIRDGDAWALSASAQSAHQLWIDVWPVVDTVLEARAQRRSPGFFSGGYSLRLIYSNQGRATAQIFEAEAIGGSNSVELGIRQTGTHDAGLDVHRGGREINLASGDGIDSHLPPSDRHDRGLSYTPGVPVTLVLRGNFPEVRVELPTGT